MVSTNTQIRKYEIVFISNPEITDQEIEELVKIVSEEINDLSGTIIKTDIWGLKKLSYPCLLYTSPSPRDGLLSRMPSSA